MARSTEYNNRYTMRTKPTWIVLFLFEVLGVISVWIFTTGRWQVNPHGTTAHLKIGMLMGVAIFVAIMVIFLTPVWILTTGLRLKQAINSAFTNDYKRAYNFLTSPNRLLVPFLPLPKYAEIIRILRHLCEDRKKKPEGMSSEFSEYIVKDEWGNYVLNWEGKEKMMKIVNSGWFFNAEKAEKLASPKTFKILMRLVVIVAIIRGIALIIHMLTHHFEQKIQSTLTF